MIGRWTTALVGAVMVMLSSYPTAASASVRHEPHHLGVIRVAVLNFDPTVPSEGGRRLHSVLGWTAPRTLAAGYRADVRRASGGKVRYRVDTWKDIDAFPASVDGLRFDVASYLEFARTGSYPTPIMDYPRMLSESGLVRDVNRGKIDEIWLYGGPGFGYWEAAMAGPGAFDVNGGVYPEVPGLRRPVVLMGFSYERGADGRLNDWWKYVYDYAHYDAQGRPLRR